jgi:hypothetical protein
MARALYTGLVIWRILNTWNTRKLLPVPMIDSRLFVKNFVSKSFDVKISNVDTVTFTWPKGAKPTVDMQHLVAKYDDGFFGSCKTISQIIKNGMAENPCYIETAPLCAIGFPASNLELTTCLQHIAKALCALHQQGMIEENKPKF